ncbi:DUF2599 domain-containing protein [Gordonia amarae]|nr:DUF2599 domain-containing protein [Gordonia amarae]QHN16210.1 DUF2599 domain-containing protein [Gordonia amarae]QHN20779.1 DUF2599 domain-containing protein [Gordonia amarae]QHN29631.1 DUF2599 domain-containing protein [Gordonia amarae]QHN38406.1 DUF2599 domain-containing protein [Gordonia amarae]
MRNTRRTEAVRRRVRVSVAIAAVCVVSGAAACGDSGDDTADTGLSVATSSAAPAPTESSAALTPTEPPVEPSPAPVYKPPYIDHVQWVETEVGPSLQIYPTVSGRNTSDPTAGDEAWSEVRKLDASADSPGMRAQFDCHWTFARLVDPDKTSWNLEPRRPVVTTDEMISARCNPGFAEEPGN